MDEVNPELLKLSHSLYRVSVKIITIKQKQMLFVLEDEGWYSLPGGGWDYKYDMRQALAEELYDEVGLSVDDVLLSDSPVYVAKGGIHKGMPRLFLLFRADLKDSAVIANKERKITWVNAEELKELPLGPNTATARGYLISLIV